VLPALWQELVVQRGWAPASLWQRLCWGPARLLGLAEDRLEPGSRRWLLFDPAAASALEAGDPYASKGANQPFDAETVTGRVLAVGVLPELWRGPQE
jgi:dihydroorotase